MPCERSMQTLTIETKVAHETIFQLQIIFTSAHDGFECSSVAPCVSRTTGIKKNRFAGFLTKMLKEPANLGEGIPCGMLSGAQSLGEEMPTP